MMKRILPCITIFLCCICLSMAKLANADAAADGYLITGEYDAGLQLENSDKLIVNGGNADVIDAWDNSRLEVYSTSLPLSLEGKRGVYDIHLYENSTLLFKGGATQSLKVGGNASALLTGGIINYITIYRRPQDLCLVTIDCQEGWQWLYTSGKITGIQGLWDNGTPFQITLSNVGTPYPPTAQYVNVIPEPATMLLLGLGGLLLRQKVL